MLIILRYLISILIMKFKEIYDLSRKTVSDALSAMWCGDANANNPIQMGYVNQIRRLINESFAPDDGDNKAMPLVQRADNYEHVDIDEQTALGVLGAHGEDLWRKACRKSPNDHPWPRDVQNGNHFIRPDLDTVHTYPPYQHQYDCWKALTGQTEDGRLKSAVVTTGTGSGKTECFMLPLVADLQQELERTNQHAIKAIFIYPLNALMEDQKKRLNELLLDTGLTFAVYNGNLPDHYNNNPATAVEQGENRRIQKDREDYEQILPTRDEMRANVPDILLTNPTMLEYMLLRNEDRNLFTRGRLRWIVVDETHSYSGAGAAELAMLLRRVLIAFDVTSDGVRFATSSATIGNSADDKMKLKQFIAGLGGISQLNNVDQVEVISGNREPLSVANDDVIQRYVERFGNLDYLYLDDLVDVGNSISEKLDQLDSLCDDGFKVKVHFFFRVLNNGLRLQLSQHANGCFTLYTMEPSAKNQTGEPYLELFRCKNCRTYVAIGEVIENQQHQKIIKAITRNDDDIFDVSSPEIKNKWIFFLSQDRPNPNAIQDDDRSIPFRINGNQLIELQPNDPELNTPGFWILYGNPVKCQCGQQLQSGNAAQRNSNDDVDGKQFEDFRLSSRFINQLISPVLLSQTAEPDANGEYFPYKGHQYLSFVDSRSDASRSTLMSNLEQEKTWVYSRIVNQLARIAAPNRNEADIRRLTQELYDVFRNNPGDPRITTINRQINALQNKCLRWEDIFRLLYEDTDIRDSFAHQFTNTSETSDEINSDDGTILDDTYKKYILGTMDNLLHKRPRTAASPENLGLFTSYYPIVDEKVTNLPAEVVAFNNANPQNSINLDDWKKLIHIYLDCNIRTNEKLFFRSQSPLLDGITMENYQPRYKTEENDRRSADKPTTLMQKLLVAAHHMLQAQADVLRDSLWNQVVALGIIEADGNDGQGNPFYKFNINNLAFKQFDEIYICDLQKRNFAPVLRPVDGSLIYHGLVPYEVNGQLRVPINGPLPNPLFPFVDGVNENGEVVSPQMITQWARENSPLWNDIWSDGHSFSNLITKYYSFPDIYIEAEHTAQIDKVVAKASQEMFVNHQINILACSTTMEMGVDLGDLEIVVMNSVPPQPSNYKQRAGRCGRRDKPRSVCVTLCGSDAVGIRTLRNPLKHIINYQTAIPSVDLSSKQIIQRHVNAYIFRKFLEINQLTAYDADDRTLRVVDFFTSHRISKEEYQTTIRNGARRGQNVQRVMYTIGNGVVNIIPIGTPIVDNAGAVVGIGDNYYFNANQQTHYMCLLNQIGIDVCPNGDTGLARLLSPTPFAGDARQMVDDCRNALMSCFQSLEEAIKYQIQCFMKVNLPQGSQWNDNPLPLLGSDCPENLNNRDLYQGLKNRPNARKPIRSIASAFSERLDEFLAKHRFTPNANMPINVVECEINSNEYFTHVDNPSYSLEKALSQYTPGRNVVLSNRVYKVAGIKFGPNPKFGTLYHNDTLVSTEDNANIQWLKWTHNDQFRLDYIEPFSYVTDSSRGASRSLNNDVYANVNAQLIGAEGWRNDGRAHTLMECQRNDPNNPNAFILYYNVGAYQYGFCICQTCGRAVSEPQINIANNQMPPILPPEIIDHKNLNTGNQCEARGYYRNYVLAGKLHTDYAEIRIKHHLGENWIDSRDDDEALLTTLALVFCKVLPQRIGKDQKDVSFTIMPNGHICIFDTNNGGSGYSNQLANEQTMSDVINLSYEYLLDANCKELILDSSTNRYSEKIDVESAINWLENERNLRIPNQISNVFQTARRAVIRQVVDDITDVPDDCLHLFVNDDWDKWNYQSWSLRSNLIHAHFLNERHAVLDVICDELPAPMFHQLRPASDWLNINQCHHVYMPNNLIEPIAYVNHHLYFTIDASSSSLNDAWGSKDLFCADVNDFQFEENPIDVNADAVQIFFIDEERDEQIRSNNLATIVEDKANALIQSFYDYCNINVGARLEIAYYDEHLKSKLAMIVSLQFIKAFIRRINLPFSLTLIMEEYQLNNGNFGNHSYLNYSESCTRDRDAVLSELLDDDDLYNNTYVIRDLQRGQLPHFRYLSFKCGTRELRLYPHGGIHNEWSLDLSMNRPAGYFRDNTSLQDNVPLVRGNSIMYVVEIRDNQ
jgi:hypothetical protein